MDNHRSKIIIVICLVISAISLVYVLWSKNVQPPQAQTSYPPPQAEAKLSPDNSVISPDGKLTLTMKVEKGSEANNYRFLMSKSSDGTQKEVFATSLPPANSLSIPSNTFSPDDKYFFLKENAPSGVKYFALTVTGDPITKDAQTLTFSDMFASKYTDFQITDATGWGGTNLIVFNTDKSGVQGPSFWFEVPSQAFIQLSTRFN